MEEATRLKKIQQGLKVQHGRSEDLSMVYVSPKSGKISDHKSNNDTMSKREPVTGDKRIDRNRKNQISNKLMANMLELKSTIKPTKHKQPVS